VVGEGEKVFFKVSGTHTVHLTGNYVIPGDDGMASLYDDDEDEEEEYDLEPDEDELDALDALVDGASESDELDDLEDPRIAEIDSEDEKAPKLIKDAGKGKNKRPAEDSEEEEAAEGATLEDIIEKSIKKAGPTTESTTNSETKKLSKAEKKRQKKLKKNDGEAAPAPPTATTSTDGAKDSPAASKKEQQPNGTASAEKKVQFAKNLEQGPTPSSSSAKPNVGIREVQGVKIDDRKVGSGPAAKKGSRLELRYIGKLTDGKVFDANKSGKPFSVKLGTGEVIKGWDIGLEGIQVGGERRITIPAKHAYGSKALPGIPGGSTLVFDVKCLTVK
jgi:FK506-binding nuclear protein